MLSLRSSSLKLKRISINILVLASLSVALPLLSAQCSVSQTLDPTESIESIKSYVEPILIESTAWSTKVCFALLSAYAFYVLAIRITKIGD